MMAKIVKSISLDAETIPLAEAKDNFSAWVRGQLYNEILLQKECIFFTASKWDKVWNPELNKYDETRLEKEEICNGMRPIRCPTCYPEGKPTSEDWLAYTRFEIDLEELLQRTHDRYEAIAAVNDPAPSKNGKDGANTPPLKGQKKYVRRLLWWIWSYI